MWLPTPLSPPVFPLSSSLGCVPHRKLFLHHLSSRPTTVRQTSRWAIWLAVSSCLFPCCRDVRWDKTLFRCICQVPSVGFQRNAKSLGYGTCGRADWPTAVRGAPLHNCLNTFSFWLFYFWPSVIVPHFIAIVPQFCQDSIELYEPNNSRIFGRSNPNYINWRQNIIMARFQFRFSI